MLRKTGRMGMFGIMSASMGSGIGAKLNLLKVFLGAPFFHPGQLIPGNKGVFGVKDGGGRRVPSRAPGARSSTPVFAIIARREWVRENRLGDA